jgi:Flp pilus assembly protein TadD
VIEAGTGNAEKAIAAFQRALDRDPRSAAARRELGGALAKLGRFEEAEAAFRKAIELRPDDWATYSYFGGFLVGRGRAAEADPLYRKGLEIAPQNARLWAGLGGALYYRSQTADAKAAWARSIALFPAPSVISNLATIQFDEQRFADAARTLERATQLGTRDYRVWRNYAAALYWAPGEREKAPAAYRRAAELAEAERKIDPRNPLTLVALADCYAMLGEKSRARDLVSEGLRAGPVDGPLAQIAAGVYEVIGDRGEALRWLSEALRNGVSPDEVGYDPTFASLRTDPRWISLVTARASPATKADAPKK